MADLLYSLDAIAQHMGLSLRQVRHLIEQHDMPVFKLGNTVCANRSSIDRWSRDLEGKRPWDVKTDTADF